jgi:hypothetical protein
VARRTDTVVKARYGRGDTRALSLAKGHVRYAIHRTNDAGKRQYREIWDRDGSLAKATAYDRLDSATSRDYVYRLMLSPHPTRQDAGQQLDLRSWTRSIMARLEPDVGQRLSWFAVTHDHADHRHVHVVAVSPHAWRVPQLRAMCEAGDDNALVQQRQLERDQRTPVPARDSRLEAARQWARAQDWERQRQPLPPARSTVPQADLPV